MKNGGCCLVAESCPTLLQTHGLQPTRLLGPCDFPVKNTGVGCGFLLQGIFPNQGLDPSLLHWQAGDALPLSHLGSHAMKNIYLQIKNAEEKRVERKAPKCTRKWWQWLGGPTSAWFPFDQCLLSGKGGHMGCSVRQSLAGYHAVMSNGDHQGVTDRKKLLSGQKIK